MKKLLFLLPFLCWTAIANATEQFSTLGSSTLNGAVTSSATSLTLTSAATFPGTGTFTILIDSELITVGAGGVAGNVLSSLTRGAEGTAAVAHSSGAVVTEVLTARGMAQLKNDLLTNPTEVGDETVSNANNNASAVAHHIHAGAGTLAAAFALCPSNASCIVHGDPGFNYNVGNLTIGLTLFNQTLELDGATVTCNGTSGGLCLGETDKGRLVCNTYATGANNSGSLITSTSGAIYDAIIGNSGYAGSANTRFDMEGCTIITNSSSTIHNAIVELAGVAGFAYISNTVISGLPAGSTGMLFTGVGGNNDNGVLVNGLWIASGGAAPAHLLRLSSVAGNSGTVVGFTCLECMLVDSTGTGDYISVDNNSTGTNFPTGIFIPSPYLEIGSGSTNYSGTIVNILAAFHLEMPDVTIYHAGSNITTTNAISINGANISTVHISGRIQGSIATNTINNANSGYVNSAAGDFNYEYTKLSNGSGTVVDTSGIITPPNTLATFGTCNAANESKVQIETNSTAACAAGATATNAGSTHCQILCHQVSGVYNWVQTGL